VQGAHPDFVIKKQLTVLQLPMLNIAGGTLHCQGYAHL
jgi:hypothetical protein